MYLKTAVIIPQLNLQPAIKEEWPSLGRPQRAEVPPPAAAHFEPKLIAADLTTHEAEKGAQEEGEKPAELDDTMVTGEILPLVIAWR